jgi:hypothetical protein
MLPLTLADYAELGHTAASIDPEGSLSGSRNGTEFLRQRAV